MFLTIKKKSHNTQHTEFLNLHQQNLGYDV